MTSTDKELLSEAVARNCAAVLSLPSAGMLRHHKSRFLNDSPDGFWIEGAKEDALLIGQLIDTAQPCGISFKNGHTKVMFASRVLRFDPDYKINSQTIVPALLLAPPAEIKATQRRANYRVRTADDCGLMVRIWRMPPRVLLRDQPMAAQEIKSKLCDVSLGGVGVILYGRDGEPPKVSAEDRLRVQLTRDDNTLLIEGRLRAPLSDPKASECRTGIQFKTLENDLEGRQVLAQLTRIVGELQRDEVRQARLGMLKAG